MLAKNSWVAGAVTLAIAGNAGAADVAFTPRVAVGMQKYKLKWDADPPSGNSIQGNPRLGKLASIDDSMPTFTLGGTVSMLGGLYLDAYWSKTGDTGRDTAESSVQPPPGSNDDTFTFRTKSKANRSDYAITLGYGLENGLSFFGGYKYGKTDVDGNAEVFKNNIHDGNGKLNAKFEADGPFLGLGYGLHLGSGMLSLTGAWAKLDGKASSRTVYSALSNNPASAASSTVPDPLASETLVTKPDANGYSLSLGWKAPITNQLYYGISVDAYKYDFKKKESYANGTLSARLKATEESLGIRASLSYSF